MKNTVISRHFTKLIYLFIMMFSSICLIPVSAQTTVDFSGTWKLDISKSDTLPSVTSETLIINQSGDSITINRTIEAKNTNPVKGVFKYAMGKSTEKKSKAGTLTTTCAWGPELRSFSVTDSFVSEKNGVKQESKRVSTYSLSEDIKILTVISDDYHPSGSNRDGFEHFKQVFIKK